MKKSLTFVLAIAGLWSCKQEIPVDYVVLSGKVDNYKANEFLVSSFSGFSKMVPVKKNGTILDTLYIENNGTFQFRFEKNQITSYLEKGAKVILTANIKDFTSSVKFTGDFKDLNNYFAYKNHKDFSFMENRSEHYLLEESAFEELVNSIADDYREKLTSVKNLPESIEAKELRAINYGVLYKKESYERMHRYYTKNNEFNASESFKKDIDNMALNNGADYLYCQDYNRFVSRSISDKMYAFYQKDSLSYKEAQDKALSSIENDTIRNTEMYNNIAMTLARSLDKEGDLKAFLSKSTNENHKTKAKALFETLKVLDPGQPSPTFENYESFEGEAVSLNDFKGKYVYIDVWATWCAPCKREIPFLKELEKEYHDKNIEFVSISVDKQDTKDKWKKMVTEKELEGVQLIADNDFSSKFVTDYKITGIPRFILLDPQGNIVKASAPRPSDSALKELFNSLNI
ncbi:TlpA family protein disulfide reductase [Gaetbulibacter saemankumensis]|uniref:TlpA family protein disulfide reductase n=1 Tax=Gaetbulibacter saemankumensis TaxID=311208 RepID=UPI0003F9541A|nr:TlpA disulfide reductase family protein [Gaetbulibacter saemankumensis]